MHNPLATGADGGTYQTALFSSLSFLVSYSDPLAVEDCSEWPHACQPHLLGSKEVVGETVLEIRDLSNTVCSELYSISFYKALGHSFHSSVFLKPAASLNLPQALSQIAPSLLLLSTPSVSGKNSLISTDELGSYSSKALLFWRGLSALNNAECYLKNPLTCS